MLYLGIPGGIEIYIVIGAIVLLFGAKKIPELARSMGSGINQFKKGLAEPDDEQKALDQAEPPRALSEEQRGSEKS